MEGVRETLEKMSSSVHSFDEKEQLCLLTIRDVETVLDPTSQERYQVLGTHIDTHLYTVEPLIMDTLGSVIFVHCREVSIIRRLEMY